MQFSRVGARILNAVQFSLAGFFGADYFFLCCRTAVYLVRSSWAEKVLGRVMEHDAVRLQVVAFNCGPYLDVVSMELWCDALLRVTAAAAAAAGCERSRVCVLFFAVDLVCTAVIPTGEESRTFAQCWRSDRGGTAVLQSFKSLGEAGKRLFAVR